MIVEHVSDPLLYATFLMLTGDRIDLAGWQLDKLAENPKRQVEDVSESDSDEDVPFACLICRKHYTDPVVTKCGHYFCSSCAIKRFSKTPKCAACGAPTGGMFNRADKILEKINKKKGKIGEDDDGSFGGEVGGVEIEGLDEAGQVSNEQD
jgi:RING finger protein 113A